MDDDHWYGFVGNIGGFLGAAVTFIAIYIAAVGSVGWVIGIALGWIPAYLGALLCFAVVRYLWLPVILLLAGALLLA